MIRNKIKGYISRVTILPDLPDRYGGRMIGVGGIPDWWLDVCGDINITDPGNVDGYTYRINGIPVSMGGGGSGVASFNGVTGAVTLDGSGGISVSQSGNAFTITGSGGVSSWNGVTGAVVLASGANIGIQQSGNTFTISSAGGGGTGGAVSSVFSRTGIVTAQPGDYNATQINLNPVIGSWTNVQQALTGLGNRDASTILLNPAVDGWSTVQAGIEGLQSDISLLTRGMVYIGFFDAVAGIADFTQASGIPSGPLPAASSVQVGDYVIVTTSATVSPFGLLRVGDQLISDGTNWNLLPIGAGEAQVVASQIPLDPVIGTWETVQDALGSINSSINTINSQLPNFVTVGNVVTSVAVSGNPAGVGAITLLQGANVTLNQSGNNITISSAGGGGSTSSQWIDVSGGIWFGGNVGINKSNPQVALDVVGEVDATITNPGSGGGFHSARYTNDNLSPIFYSWKARGTPASPANVIAGDWSLYFGWGARSSAGTGGIDQGSLGAQTNANGITADLILNINDGSDLVGNGPEVMRWSAAAGRVLIGQTTDKDNYSKLQVTNNIGVFPSSPADWTGIGVSNDRPSPTNAGYFGAYGTANPNNTGAVVLEADTIDFKIKATNPASSGLNFSLNYGGVVGQVEWVYGIWKNWAGWYPPQGGQYGLDFVTWNGNIKMDWEIWGPTAEGGFKMDFINATLADFTAPFFNLAIAANQTTTALNTTNLNGSLVVSDGGNAYGSGAALILGGNANAGIFGAWQLCAIKAGATDGSGYAAGTMSFLVRPNTADPNLYPAMSIGPDLGVTFLGNIAVNGQSTFNGPAQFGQAVTLWNNATIVGSLQVDANINCSGSINAAQLLVNGAPVATMNGWDSFPIIVYNSSWNVLPSAGSCIYRIVGSYLQVVISFYLGQNSGMPCYIILPMNVAASNPFQTGNISNNFATSTGGGMIYLAGVSTSQNVNYITWNNNLIAGTWYTIYGSLSPV